MELFAQILGFLAGLILLISLQLKKRVLITIGIAVSQAVFSVSFFILGVTSGGVFSAMLFATGLINFFITQYYKPKNEKFPIPIWLICAYYAAAVALGVIF